MPLDIGSGGTSIASLEIPVVLTGLDQAKAQLATFGTLGDQAAGRVSASFGSAEPAITKTAAATRNLTGTLVGSAGAMDNFAGRAKGSASALDALHALLTGARRSQHSGETKDVLVAKLVPLVESGDVTLT